MSGIPVVGQKTRILPEGGTHISGIPTLEQFEKIQSESSKPAWLLQIEKQWFLAGKLTKFSTLKNITGTQILQNSSGVDIDGVHIDSTSPSDKIESSSSASSSTSASSSFFSDQTQVGKTNEKVNQFTTQKLKTSNHERDEVQHLTVSSTSSSSSSSMTTSRSMFDCVAHIYVGTPGYMQGGTLGEVTFNQVNGKIEFNYNQYRYDLDTAFPGDYWIFPGSEPAQLKVNDPRGSSYFLEPRPKKNDGKSYIETSDSFLESGPQDALIISSDVSISGGGTFENGWSTPGYSLPPPPGYFLPPPDSSYLTSTSSSPQESWKSTGTIFASLPGHSEISNPSASSPSQSTLEIDKSETLFSEEGGRKTSGTFKPGGVFKRFFVNRGPASSNNDTYRTRVPLIPLVDESQDTDSISASPSTDASHKAIPPLSQPLKPLVLEKTEDGIHVRDKHSIPNLHILEIRDGYLNLDYFGLKYALHVSLFGKYSLKCDPFSKKVQAIFPDGSRMILKPSA